MDIPTDAGTRRINCLDALAFALDWTEGRRSYANLGPHSPYTPDVIAAMDAQEVVKWSALATSLHAMEFKEHYDRH